MIKVMILGTFHFKNRSKDFLYGNHNVQENDIIDLLVSLKRFNPTKIAVEFDKESDSLLESQYQQYLTHMFEISEDEIYQLGFRLAKELGHKKLFAIDWNKPVEGSISMGDVFEQLKNKKKESLVDDLLKDGKEFLSFIENSKSLKDALKTLNSKEMINKSSWLNERLLNFNFSNELVGNKWLMGWHFRNLNIASNLLDVLEEDDRVLVIYGSSHTKLLKYLINQDPRINLISPLDYM